MAIAEFYHLSPITYPITEAYVLKTINWATQPLLAKRVVNGKTYEYRLGTDRYVYQFIDGECNGWLTTHTIWKRTLRYAFEHNELMDEPTEEGS